MSEQRSQKIPVAILGATGVVGQRLLRALDGHPWFEVAEVAASPRRAGMRLSEAAPWRLPGGPPAFVESKLRAPDPRQVRAPLVLSALDAGAAREIEPAFAAAGRVVVSNAAAHRMAEHVPLVVPEVNAEHLAILPRGARGVIVTNPNCSTIALALALAPIARARRVTRVVVSTMQAVSGAGYPGVPALDIVGNVVPGIPGEEEKIERELPKIFGRLRDGRVEPASMRVSAHSHRVPVEDGHLMAVSLEADPPIEPQEALERLLEFRGEPQERRLPSAPVRPVVVCTDPHRPQPRLDREAGNGMAVTVGRVRRCPVLGLRLVVLGHNTIRGAAGGTLLLAELLAARGLLG
ncbi:MAG: aspartate-semialdehyde dehydrogenase [Acidobacteria bacterium]|nr:MAG: aspartate-semialdehyde dehydrogenase [Acidobacteriota bacterium]